MAEPNSYEEQRRRRVEENKRKVEALHLHNLFAAVCETAVEPMPNQTLKPRNPLPPPGAPTRRSGRIAGLGKQPQYHSGRTSRNALPKPLLVYATNEERTYAFSKADELRKQLDPQYPSFLRPMSPSYSTGIYLLIPSQFSKRYLPCCDETVVLVDEEGVEFQVLYCAHRSALSGIGWRPFAVHHKLAHADCLVFHLVETRKFKVYIIRASSYYAKDH